MHIAIIGGGMTGWITAFVMGARHPQVTFTVLDARRAIPSIGVGEGTTGYFLDVVIQRANKFSLDEFIKETKATPKLAIKFQDWAYPGHEFLSPVDGSVSKKMLQDFAPLYDYVQSSKNSETVFGETSSILAMIRRLNLTPFYRDTEKLDWCDVALHLDNQLTIEFLKKQALKLPNVECIETVVSTVNENKYQINEIVCEDGNKINADIYFDCTGFKRVLSNNVPWVSFAKELPLNSVITFQTPNQGEIPDLVTTAKAHENGWLWTIPTQERYGNGYLYSDKFISDDDALSYVKEKYSVDTVGQAFKFKPGKLTQSWHKNIVALGLTYHFLEPLQATSIHLLLTQLDLLSEYTVQFSSLEKEIADKYNSHIDKVIDNYKDFVAAHYSVEREDSKFWKEIAKKKHLSKKTQAIIKKSQTGLKILDFDTFFGSIGRDLWIYTLLGMGHLSGETCESILEQTVTPEQVTFFIGEYEKQCQSAGFMSYPEFLQKVNG